MPINLFVLQSNVLVATDSEATDVYLSNVLVATEGEEGNVVSSLNSMKQ